MAQLLTPIILLFQSIIESKDWTIERWWIYKKRNRSSLTNQALFPKSKYDYIAAYLKPFNGFFMPKGKIQILLSGIRVHCVAQALAPHYLSSCVPQKAPHAPYSQPRKMFYNSSKPLAFSAPMPWIKWFAFFWKVHLPSSLSLFSSNSVDQFTFKDWFSSETFPPSFLLLEFPIKQWPHKRQWPYANQPSHMA